MLGRSITDAVQGALRQGAAARQRTVWVLGTYWEPHDRVAAWALRTRRKKEFPMEHLVGRLSESNPDAADSLRVVAYFDTLIARGSGVDGLLRGAAVLAGCTAGAEICGRVRRRDPDGHEPTEGARAPYATQRSGTDWSVWLERDGDPEPMDEMIVDRLSFGVELLQNHRRPTGFEAVIDEERSLSDRVTRLARFSLDPGKRMRIIATASSAPPIAGATSAVVPTPYGLVRSTLDTTGTLDIPGPAGFGQWVRADHAPDSWAGALIALRLTDVDDPVVDADELGAMLMLLRAHNPQDPHPDVGALAALDGRSAHVLRTLVETDSIRSAAAALGMHHSSVQARHGALTEQLGYDARTPLGRMRYIAAALILRLSDPPGAGSPS